MENLLEVRGLSKSFPQFELEDLNFDLPAGVIMGFIGENGAGKSTTIKLILNLLHKDAGKISVLGYDSTTIPAKAREEIGVVFDECNIHENYTISDVHSVMKGFFTNWDDEVWKAYLQKFKLPAGKKVKDFSRGTKVKLMLAIALSHHPRLLILDEATSGLDPIIRDEILEEFYQFVQDEGHSILISSHIISDLEKVCDYVLFIHQGRLRFLETKDKLRDEYAIWKGTKADLDSFDPAAIIGKRQNPYGVEALVSRSKMPAAALLEPATIEEIMLFTIKEGVR